MLKNIYSPFLSDSGHNRKVFLYFNDFFFVVNTTKIFPILSNLPLQDNINYNSITITKNQVKNILNGQCNSSPCLIKLYTLSKFTLYNANKILHKNCIGNPFAPNKGSLHVLLTPHLNGNDFSLSVIPWKIKFQIHYCPLSEINVSQHNIHIHNVHDTKRPCDRTSIYTTSMLHNIHAT